MDQLISRSNFSDWGQLSGALRTVINFEELRDKFVRSRQISFGQQFALFLVVQLYAKFFERRYNDSAPLLIVVS